MKTKNSISCTLLSILILFVLCGYVFGQNKLVDNFPNELEFNGILTDINKEILTDNFYNFTFYIYKSAISGEAIWSEVHENIPVMKGEFNVVLGHGTDPNPLDLPFDSRYYLGIKINNEPEMSERLELASVPYSLSAKYADNVSDGSITNEKLASVAITNEKIKNIRINKITNLPSAIGTLARLKAIPQIMGSDYEWWTTQGNLIYGQERHFLGVLNDRDFVIRTWEIQRMLFDPYGYIVLGREDHLVDFEVFGLSIFDYVFIQGNLGVGVDPALAKMHINAPLNKTPFLVDYLGSNIFSIDTEGRVVITTTLSGSESNIDNYPLYIHGSDNGISIRVDGSSDGDHNFMSFWDDGGMVGRIEGQNVGEYFSDPENIATDVYMVVLIAAEVVAATAWVPPAIPLEPADIIAIAADIAEFTFVTAWESTHLGVTYESGSGDYAEWLEKTDPNEMITAGDIVSVNGGKITKNTFAGEQFMAISSNPIILGNMPKNGKDENFKMVAFMGQIPVKIMGIVKIGDFVIPSGLNDGTGIAISPELITLDLYNKIIGRAWASSDIKGIALINIHVGINNMDLGLALTKLDNDDKKISSGIEKLENSVQSLFLKSNKIKLKLSSYSEQLDELLYFIEENNHNVSRISN